MEWVFRARVPMMTFPLKTISTPDSRPDAAQMKLSRRLVFESVVSLPMGFWEPVRMMGLGEFWIR